MVGGGEIKLSDINAELGRTAGTQISLTQAAEGVYATINTDSAVYPNGTAPHALSEWYSYHHGTIPPPAYSTMTGLKFYYTSEYSTYHPSCISGTTYSDVLYFDNSTGLAYNAYSGGVFSGLFTGYFMNNGDCTVREFSSGNYVGMYYE